MVWTVDNKLCGIFWLQYTRNFFLIFLKLTNNQISYSCISLSSDAMRGTKMQFPTNWKILACAPCTFLYFKHLGKWMSSLYFDNLSPLDAGTFWQVGLYCIFLLCPYCELNHTVFIIYIGRTGRILKDWVAKGKLPCCLIYTRPQYKLELLTKLREGSSKDPSTLGHRSLWGIEGLLCGRNLGVHWFFVIPVKHSVRSNTLSKRI